MNDLPVIAIVDDDASVRRSLHRLVESAGYAVETFASGREFLEWLPRGRAACLVLDVHMNEAAPDLRPHRSASSPGGNPLTG